MICLIFTRKKLLVGVKGKITEFLRFSNKPYIDYSGQRMYDIFDNYFPRIIEEFLVYAKKNQLAIQDTIPIVLSFPSETYQSPAGKQTISDIKNRIEDTLSPTFSIASNQALHIAYLRGVQLQEEVLEEGCVLVEAIDGFPSLVYIYHPEDGLKGGHVAPIQRMGISGSSQSLLQALESEFGKMGLSLNQEDREVLLQQIQQQPAVDSFTLDKSYGAAKMKLEVARSSLIIDDPMLVYQKVFDEWLNEAKLEGLGAKKLFLVGDILKQGVVRSYIDELLSNSVGIEIIEHVRTQAIWKFIVKGSLDSIPKEQKIGTTNGTHYKKNYPKLNYEYPFPTIPDKNSQDPPPQEFTPQETFEDTSYADEILKSIDEKPSLESSENTILSPISNKQTKEPDKAVGNEIEDNSWMARLGFQDSPHQIAKSSQDLSFLDIYHVIQKWEGAPFNNYEVQDKVNQGKFILKNITKEELESSENRVAFYDLFEKEKLYYDLQADLSLTKEGLYYLRPFLRGQSLLKSVHENKIDKKKSLAEFNSRDLKLIVTVLDMIKALNVSHTSINEHNILIFKSRGWNLRREYFATLIGFTEEECSKEDMLEQMHSIFERLLMKNVYKQLRQTLEI